MNEIIGEWIGGSVSVTLRFGTAAPSIVGNLYRANESGVVIEIDNGLTFIPMTSVLHITRA